MTWMHVTGDGIDRMSWKMRHGGDRVVTIDDASSPRASMRHLGPLHNHQSHVASLAEVWYSPEGLDYEYPNGLDGDQ
jgi:hypothetical protein